MRLLIYTATGSRRQVREIDPARPHDVTTSSICPIKEPQSCRQGKKPENPTGREGQSPRCGHSPADPDKQSDDLIQTRHGVVLVECVRSRNIDQPAKKNKKVSSLEKSKLFTCRVQLAFCAFLGCRSGRACPRECFVVGRSRRLGLLGSTLVGSIDAHRSVHSREGPSGYDDAMILYDDSRFHLSLCAL
jgi:hypothetical protein